MSVSVSYPYFVDEDYKPNNELPFPVLKVVLIGDDGSGKMALQMVFHEGGSYNPFCSWGWWECTTANTRVVCRHMKFEEKHIAFQMVHTRSFSLKNRPRWFCELELKDTDGVLVVFDVTNKESFESVPFWLSFVEKNIPDASVVLVGNKIDLPGRVVDETEAHQFADEHGVPYVEASAKTNVGVTDAFTLLARNVFSNSESRPSKRMEELKATDEKKPSSKEESGHCHCCLM